MAVPFAKFNGFKPALIKQINSISGYTTDIIGNVRIVVLPNPKIIIEKVNISSSDHQILNADQLALFPSLTSLLGGNLKITTIEIIGGDLTIDDLRQSTKSLANISSISLSKSRIKLPNQTLFAESMSDFEGTIKLPSLMNKDFELNSNYTAGGFKFKLKALVKGIDNDGNSSDATIIYGSNLFNLGFNGNIKGVYSSPDFDGTAELTLNQLPSTDEYWNDLTNFLIKDENLSIKGAAKVDHDSIRISDIKIDSSSISNGTANFLINFGKETNLSMDAKIEHINLSLLQGKKIDESLTFDNFLKRILESFNLTAPENLVGNFNLNISKITYNNDVVTNTAIQGDILNSEFFLNQFDAKFPGDATLNITGILDHNQVRPKFEGNINFGSKDINKFFTWLGFENFSKTIISKTLEFQSAFSIIPRNLKIYNAKMLFNNIMMTGKYILRHSGEPRLNSRLSLRASEFDSNQYSIPDKLDSILHHLYLFDNDKSGRFFLEYTDDFAWLRRIPINFGIELQIDNMKYKNTVLQNFQANTRFTPSNLYIDRLAFKNDFMDIEAGAHLAITALSPKLDANITVNNMNAAIASTIIPSISNMKDFQSKYIAYIDKNKSESLPSVDYLTSGNFNFFSCHNFTGNIKLKLKNYFNDNINIQNADFDMDLVEGAINVNHAKGRVFGGNFDITGNIGNSSLIPSFNFTFGLSNFNPSEFLRYFFDLDFIKGYASISGVFASSGKDYQAFFNNFNASILALAKKITISGFDITELTKVTEEPMNRQQQAEVLTTYSRKGESLFDELSGNANIKKGIMSINGATFKSNRVAGVYSAFIDLHNQLINGQGRMSFKPINSNMPITIDIKQSGKISEQNSGLNLDNLVSFLKNSEIRSTQDNRYNQKIMQSKPVN